MEGWPNKTKQHTHTMLLIAIALYLRIVTTPPPDVVSLVSSFLFLSAKANLKGHHLPRPSM
jgi:energy-coupling factor transporter transmembrane protein EcfT